MCGHPWCPEQWACLSVKVLGCQSAPEDRAPFNSLQLTGSFQVLWEHLQATPRELLSVNQEHFLWIKKIYSDVTTSLWKSELQPDESQLPRDLGCFLAGQSQAETMSSETSAQTPVSGICCWKLRVLRAALSLASSLAMPAQPRKGLFHRLRNSPQNCWMRSWAPLWAPCSTRTWGLIF